MGGRAGMSYIEEIRAKVGHMPLILVGAGILILNESDQLLMLLRTDNDSWGVPGGMMEPGETTEETARRETFEETGLQVNQVSFWGVFSGPEYYYRYPNGDEVYNVSIIYTAEGISGEVLIDPVEHSRMAYFPLDRLPEPISPAIKPVLELFRKSRLGI
jgi:8-oxo-dGTP pyrophosphatase MutT (NUDIX family)